jgi:hypothetical protein
MPCVARARGTAAAAAQALLVFRRQPVATDDASSGILSTSNSKRVGLPYLIIITSLAN